MKGMENDWMFMMRMLRTATPRRTSMEEMRSEAATGPIAGEGADIGRECRPEEELKQEASWDLVIDPFGHCGWL